MEIKPYRSQVRETPTPEPTNTRINTLGAKSYAAWGSMISQAGQNTASSMYNLNKVMQGKRDADDDMAYRAICQDIDQAFLNFGNQTADFFQQDANDPNKVFYEDKSTYDKFYQDGINQIQINTIDKVKNPRVQEAARLYFNQKRMEAGQDFLTAYNENKKNAEVIVFGKELDDKVQKAIGAKWDEDINLYKDDIEKTVNDMAGRGLIRKDQVEDMIKDVGKKIEYGRAVNTLDALINADRYEDAQRFIDIIPDKGLDEGAKKALQDHFKDRMGMKKNILEHQQGEAYNQGIDLYNKGQLTREWVDSQEAFNTHPELDINTDYRTFFRSLLDAKDKAMEEQAKSDKAMEAQAKSDKGAALYRDYFNRIDNILIGASDEDKDKLRDEIKNSTDLTNQQVEHLVGLLNGTISKSSAGSGGKGAKNYRSNLSEFYEILLNGANTPQERKRQFAEWFPKFIMNNPDAAEDLTWFDSMIEKADKFFTLPEVKVLQAEVEKKIKAYQEKGDIDRATSLINASGSFFQVLAETMWWKTGPKGERIETSEAEREKIFKEAKERLTLLTGKDDVLDALSGITLSGNDPYFIKTKNGYAMRVDGQYDTMRDTITGSKWFRYTPQGISIYGQLENIDKQAIGDVTGEDMSGYEQRIVDNNPYYYNPSTKMAFTVARNNQGDWNVYRVMGNGELWLKTPPNIQAQIDFESENQTEYTPKPTLVSQLGTGEKTGKDAAKAVGNVAKKVGSVLNEGRKYVVKKTQGKE